MTAETKTSLLALADRCEREEASLLLDIAIECAACGALAVGSEYPMNIQAMYKVAKDRQLYNPPSYTTSLDAAVTLVPEGWNWSVERFSFDAVIPYEQSGAKSSVWRDSRNPKERLFNIVAKTPAAALCAAALRARAALVKP